MNSYASTYHLTETEQSATHVPWMLLPFLWLLRNWLVAYCPELRPAHFDAQPLHWSKINRRYRRQYRRMKTHPVPPARNVTPYRTLLPRGLSPTQFLERMSRISTLGRVCLYRIRASGSVLRRRALLVCYDHGWWRAPITRLHAGLWIVYLRPN